METTTDTNGYFSFQLSFSNQYNLDIGAAGYALDVQNLPGPCLRQNLRAARHFHAARPLLPGRLSRCLGD